MTAGAKFIKTDNVSINYGWIKNFLGRKSGGPRSFVAGSSLFPLGNDSKNMIWVGK